MVVSSNRRQRVMEELIEGRELARQLGSVLDYSDVNWGAGSAAGLVTKILGSFTNTLSILNGINSKNLTSDDHDEKLIISQIPANNIITTATAAADLSSWDAHHDAAIHDSTSTFIDPRGPPKRRKTSHSWTRDSCTWTDDGHAWRKYGQKKISNTNHLRNYYRCTHKFDQGCQATKHVQKIQGDSVPLFRTTYYGNHKCQDLLKAPHEVIFDTCYRSPSRESAATYIRFDTNTTSPMTNKQDHKQEQQHPFFSSIKKQFMVKEVEDIIPNDHHHHHMDAHSQSSPWHEYDYLVGPHDLTTFELPSISIALDQGMSFLDPIMIDGSCYFDDGYL